MALSEEEFNYLERKRTLVGKIIKRERIPVDINRKRMVQKVNNSSKNIKNWSDEYREHLIYQIVYAMVHPFPPKVMDLCQRLGITLKVMRSLMRTEKYEDVKNDLRKQLRSKWGANIDQVVIKKALLGSKYHAELFYKLQGELIEKVDLTRRDAIPTDPDKINEMIDRYIKELGIRSK